MSSRRRSHRIGPGAGGARGCATAVARIEETTGTMRGVPPRGEPQRRMGEPRVHRSIAAPAEIRWSALRDTTAFDHRILTTEP
jgi:hypothetical protein